MTETMPILKKLQNGLKSSSRIDINTMGKDGHMRILFLKGLRMKLLIIISLFIVGCGIHAQPQPEQSEEPEITEVSKPDPYWISSLGNIIPVTSKWQRGLPILRGLIRNLSTETLYNRCMRFVITERDNPDNILSDTIGYFTLDEPDLIYFPEFPYNIEHELIPGVNYYIYVAGDTIDYDISINWLFEVVLDD